MDFFGIKLVGINAENGQKLLVTLALFAALWTVSFVVNYILRISANGAEKPRWVFWVRQTTQLLVFVVGAILLVSIWLDEPKSLSTATGLATAGIAFALQKVITSFAAYFTILLGRNYSVGDRIAMGGVRGDVIAIGFLQTTIMEMGQPPAVASASPDVWIDSRQYTGRIVSVSNGILFDDPIYNYTRDFEYIWESIMIPITYQADRAAAESILLKAAQDHTLEISRMSEQALQKMQERYFVVTADLEPRVYFRITDNWLELSVRFVVEEHGIREVKDRMSRQIVTDLDAAGIGIASATYDIVGMPPLKIEVAKTSA